jgi:hypothetical protein
VVPQPEPHSGVILGRAVAAGLLLPACHPQASRILLSASDNGRTVAAEVGDEISVSLDAIGPLWASPTSFPAHRIRAGERPQRYTFEAAADGGRRTRGGALSFSSRSHVLSPRERSEAHVLHALGGEALDHTEAGIGEDLDPIGEGDRDS